jgi:Aromatic-ring-opening dioxygenase LigAB, LigA subunit
MADDKTSESNLARFVREMSEADARLEEFEEDSERVMNEAGLSEEEKEIVRRGDEAELLAAIGEVPEHGAPPTIRPPRIRFRRRRKPPPRPPTTPA